MTATPHNPNGVYHKEPAGTKPEKNTTAAAPLGSPQHAPPALPPIPPPKKPEAVTDPKLTRLLAAKEVAKMIGVHVRTLRRMYVGGKFPRPMKISQRCYRWHLGTVNEWLVANGGRPAG